MKDFTKGIIFTISTIFLTKCTYDVGKDVGKYVGFEKGYRKEFDKIKAALKNEESESKET